MTSKPTVLYVSYDGLTDPLGQSQILPYLAGLTSYDITVISFEKRTRFLSGKNEVEAFCRAHALRWVPLVYHKHPQVLSTLFDVWRLRRLARHLHRKHSFRIIHCRSYITALVGLWMKQTYGLKFIFDMRGFWADERVEGRLWNLRNPIYRQVYGFFKRKEKQFAEEADAIISLTENAKQEILGWKVNSVVYVIPCCVDVAHFDPRAVTPTQQTALRTELGIRPDEFVLLYLGSLGTWYMVTEMLILFTQVKKIRPTAKFLVVTPDRMTVANYPYRSDIIFRSSPRDKVPLFISLANASVVFIRPGFSKKASSATKMAEVLAMGVPVIANTGWGDIGLFRDSLPGLHTVSGPEEYASAFTALISQQPPVMDIRKGAEERFSLERGVALYNAVYKALL